MTGGPPLRRQRAPYAEIPEWVLYHAALTPTAKTTYAVLDRFSGQDGACFPGREVLATRVGVSVRSIDAAMEQLIAVGAVIVRHRWVRPNGDIEYLPHNDPAPIAGCRQTSNDYYVCEWPFGASGPVEAPKGEGAKSAPSGAQDLHPKESHKNDPGGSSRTSTPETYEDDHEKAPPPVLVLSYDEAMEAFDTHVRDLVDSDFENHTRRWIEVFPETPSPVLADRVYDFVRSSVRASGPQEAAFEAHHRAEGHALYSDARLQAFREADRPGRERRRALHDAWLRQAAVRIDALRVKVPS